MNRIALSVMVSCLAASGCATKRYVKQNVGDVNEKVDSLSGEVEKTQERVRSAEGRIDQVDKASQTGIAEAKGHAAQAQDSASAALTKAEDAERAARGKLLYMVVLSNDKVTFPLNRAEVAEDTKKVIHEALAPVIADNKGVFIEIEGHTDATGGADYNHDLGHDRAMAVRAYLHDYLNIALSRMEVISYGETKPLADNRTRTGRAMNRRVVIKVLE